MRGEESSPSQEPKNTGRICLKRNTLRNFEIRISNLETIIKFLNVQNVLKIWKLRNAEFKLEVQHKQF